MATLLPSLQGWLFLEFLNISRQQDWAFTGITNTTITQQLQSPPFGKCYCQLGAKIFNCPAFIWFLKPLFKERKRGSFVNWNTLHAKRSTRCCNTWPFSIIVAGMKCSIQSSLSGVFFSLPSLLMNKVHFIHLWCSFGFVSFQENFGIGCNLSSF